MAKNKPRKPRSNVAMFKKIAMDEKILRGRMNADRYRAFEQGESIGFANAVAVMLWILHKEYGYGTKRLMAFLRSVASFCNTYVIQSQEKQKKGTYQGISIDDICQALHEETGIKIDPDAGTIEGPGLEKTVKYTDREHTEEEVTEEAESGETT